MHTFHFDFVGEGIPPAQHAMILLHGRGASAEDILQLADALPVRDFALFAPKATNHTWYPFPFLAPPQHNEPWLSSALDVVGRMVKEVKNRGIAEDDIWFAGFSQGACLMLEFLARNAAPYAGALAFTGGLIGDQIYTQNYKGDFGHMPIFIGSSDPDPHVPVERVLESATVLQHMNAIVTTKIYPLMGHTIGQEELKDATALLSSYDNS
ncbi:phospholipase [Niastella yeongjuensis]|uniref:Phospholipase n=1 Tax=Niastella yeongjuensis TaxID=354355 RepID=A0A1V9EPP6_9BACT|nr:phospholipase [Niastella yeongjuensis]OQP48097.1 phospholipase [Niastella yeongjuensis]SEO26576.1 phospholipase/carboxylesterase [Niastella yeongjuensis]